ncbi:uncharacterized protein LOC125204354 [Salvia hispanica]|uniref:uncharacterized protein LOC125204354 n=1 Tax=Salvia hispanica TaxID=49212 RepID=UPI0020092B49|nr:uncharacterized protein LOC125204354 [Salvia hispanica]
MEVSWSDITAIEAVMNPNQPGRLRIELASTPLFFREISPQPGKHSNWEPTYDFTYGQAHLYMKHEVTFLPGVLDKHYEQLLINDEHLAELSRRPLPDHDKHLTELRLYSGPADFSNQKALVAHDQRQHSDVGSPSQNPIVAPASTHIDSSSSQNYSVVPDQHLYERNDMVRGGNEASSMKRVG